MSDLTGTKSIKIGNIDVEPVFVEDVIQLFDIYIDGEWQGSRRLLRYIEEEYGKD